MPFWSTTSTPSSITLMIRDDVLYYAHQIDDTVQSGHCAWPQGLTDSSLPHILSQKTHVQYIVPPENVRILHLDKPDGIEGKALINHARIELLNYIDVPIDQVLLTLLDAASLDSPYITTQVVFANALKSHMGQLEEQGITVNRISLPDGGLITDEEHADTIIVLDPNAPRIVRREQSQLKSIQPLPKASMPIEQGLCPAISASIEQWLTRNRSDKTSAPILLLCESDETATRWLEHFNEKSLINNDNSSPYPTAAPATNVAQHWVSLAAAHHKEPHYIPFDLCWARPPKSVRQFLLWPSYALLAFSMLFVGINTVSGSQAIHKKEDKLTSITQDNQRIEGSLGDTKHTMIGRYQPAFAQENTRILSHFTLLRKASFPGLWLDTIRINKKNMLLKGSAKNASDIHSYATWLKQHTDTKNITLDSFSPYQTKANKVFTRNLKQINKTIRSEKQKLLYSQKSKEKEAQWAINALFNKRTKLLISEDTNNQRRFNFSLTLHFS